MMNNRNYAIVIKIAVAYFAIIAERQTALS